MELIITFPLTPKLFLYEPFRLSFVEFRIWIILKSFFSIKFQSKLHKLPFSHPFPAIFYFFIYLVNHRTFMMRNYNELIQEKYRSMDCICKIYGESRDTLEWEKEDFAQTLTPWTKIGVWSVIVFCIFSTKFLYRWGLRI